MHDSHLMTVPELQALLSRGAVSLFDCRFDLAAPSTSRERWLEGHIPGACFADLDADLSAPPTDHSGRHPLPEPEPFAAFLARCGWRPGRPVVAYDDMGGAFAARLWFLMRYFGQPEVYVLDGGLAAWERAGLPLESGAVAATPAEPVELRGDESLVVDATGVQKGLASGRILLVDARAAARFVGGGDGLDPVAGHVPGARNRPFTENLDDQGRFRPADEVGAELRAVLAGREAADAVFMCGSGVTACHNLLAMERAGLSGARLYPGSWSEWIRDPERPVATGPA
jgi:thiosulfate/3-mercaptopyruvate sulfurtransferase